MRSAGEFGVELCPSGHSEMRRREMSKARRVPRLIHLSVQTLQSTPLDTHQILPEFTPFTPDTSIHCQNFIVMEAVKRFFSSPRFAVAGASNDANKFGYKRRDIEIERRCIADILQSSHGITSTRCP